MCCTKWIIKCNSSYFFIFLLEKTVVQSQWPRGLRRAICGRSIAEIWVRIPPDAWISVCYECCVLSGRCLRRADHASRGVLPTVMRRCVWTRNVVNEVPSGGGGGVAPKENKKRPWNGVGGQSPASNRRDRRSIPDQSMWDLWWIYWEWDRFSSEHFSFPCQYHSTNAPYSSSSTCFSCEKGQRAKPGILSKKTKFFRKFGTTA